MLIVVLCFLVSAAGSASAQDWQPASPRQLPAWATPAGFEADGTPLYIARAPLNGGIHVGEANPGRGSASITWGGSEVPITDFEIYTGSGCWVAASPDTIPDAAIPGGKEANGAPLYVIRAQIGKGVRPGKLNPAGGKGYVSYAGKEVEMTSGMELFLGTESWVEASNGEIPFGAIQGGTHPGSLNASTGKAYVPHGGREIAVDGYEVLVYQLGAG